MHEVLKRDIETYFKRCKQIYPDFEMQVSLFDPFNNEYLLEFSKGTQGEPIYSVIVWVENTPKGIKSAGTLFLRG